VHRSQSGHSCLLWVISVADNQRDLAHYVCTTPKAYMFGFTPAASFWRMRP
jgi:hypothetical protein